MVDRDDIIGWLDTELDTERFNAVDDAKFNGALVEGEEGVTDVGLCTNFTRENIEAADDRGIDLVISHHGGWAEFDQDLLEEKKELARDLGITWYVAHEPLDCADGYGISAALMQKLGIEVEGAFGEHAGGEVGRYGELRVDAEEFLRRLEEVDDHTVVDGRGRHDRGLEPGDVRNARIAVVGGGGGVFTDLIAEAADLDADIYLTGNSAFYADIYAYERGITLVTLEETSSERWGVYALGEELKRAFPDIDLTKLREKNW